MPLKVKKLTPAGARMAGRFTFSPRSASPSPKKPRYFVTASRPRFSTAAAGTAQRAERIAARPSSQFTSAETISSASAQSSPKA